MIEPVAPAVAWTIAGIFAVLAAASLTIRLLKPRLAPALHYELAQRVISWWVIVVVFSIAILLSTTASVVFLGFVSFLALKEYLSIVPTRRGDRAMLLVAYLAVPLQYWFIGTGQYGFFIIAVPVYMFLLIPAVLVIRGETAGFLRAAGTIHWGLMAAVYAIGHAAFLLTLPRLVPTLAPGAPRPPDALLPAAGAAGGAGLMLFLIVLTQANDVAQYVCGRLWGRRKVAPTVSPNKTVEGFLGGLVVTTVLAALLGLVLTPFPVHVDALAGLIIGWAGFMGDMVVSALKRDLGIKDASSLIPGHGGILDRVDSLTFTAPLFFHYSFYVATRLA